MSNFKSDLPAKTGGGLVLLRRLHFYIGLFIAPFIFIAALTGTLYVLTPQLENLLFKDALTATVTGQAQPLSAQIDAARKYAGRELSISALRPAPEPGETTRVQFASEHLGASESRAVFVDPYSLAIKGDMTVYGTSGILPLRMWLDQLHRGLLLGEPGRIYSELAASWLWVAALGGVVLWWAGRSGRKASGVRRARRWHTTLGLTLVLGLLFFSATGLTWSKWAGDNINTLRTALNWLTPQVNTRLDGSLPAAPADPHAEHHMMAHHAGHWPGMPMPTPLSVNVADSDWDRVLQAARAAGISAGKIELRQPKAADKAWTVTEIDHRWPVQVDAVSVHPRTFAVIDHIYFADFPLAAKLTRWGVDAHMGGLFGLANQLLLAFLGVGLCSLIVLGYRLWWLRRPAAASGNPLATLCGAWLTMNGPQKTLALVIAVLLGIALPVMGISLLLLIVVDCWRWWRR